MIRLDTDVLVIGGGVSGLLAAWQASRSGAMVRIAAHGSGASMWLQGLNVPLGHADPRDSAGALYEDIMREGQGLSDPTLARQTAETVAEAFHDLLALGVGFAQKDGKFVQRHAAGSTYPRCCYVPGIMWGPEARRVLRRHLAHTPNVTRHSLTIVDLLPTPEGECGAVGFEIRTHEPALIRARAVVLAAGGVGQLFAHSTYPRDIWGAAPAMAYRAGATLIDMELIQFEPLVVYHPASLRGFVVPTTLFGDGAVLRDAAGVRFLPEFRPVGEAGMSKEQLVVAMATVARDGRAEADGSVWLDATPVRREVLEGYPWLYPVLKKHGIDLAVQQLAVKPAAHTCMGGIKVDARRATGVPGLFAAGEASAGVHGAGRLAGGSATEIVVSGTLAGRSAAALARQVSEPPDWTTLERQAREVFELDAASDTSPGRTDAEDTAAKQVVDRLRELMSGAAGVWRDHVGLSEALVSVGRLATTAEARLAGRPRLGDPWLRVTDMLLVARLILAAVLQRTESRGAHQRTDYPARDPRWNRHIEWRLRSRTGDPVHDAQTREKVLA
ncbi:MAG: FAD-binding protein [Chloroflexi bacterium]|nr:FAD-binding protein [Chloroflexota bacterium]